MESQVKQAKSETYNYTQMNLPTFCVNKEKGKPCCKKKLHELFTTADHC